MEEAAWAPARKKIIIVAKMISLGAFDAIFNRQKTRTVTRSFGTRILKGVFIATQLNSTRQREQQLTQFVGRDIINKNTTDLAVRCSTGSVEFS